MPSSHESGRTLVYAVVNAKTGIEVSRWPSRERADADKAWRDEKYLDIDPSWTLEVREVDVTGWYM